MKKLYLEKYTYPCAAIEKGARPVRFHVISDLHGVEIGMGNRLLLKRIEERRPDAVLIPGDLIVRQQEKSLHHSLVLIQELAKICPVFYSPGNHETKMEQSMEGQALYGWYEEKAKALGAVVLKNQKTFQSIRGSRFIFHGLELEAKYYKKPFPPALSVDHMDELLGRPWEEGCHVLLAHNPKYGDAYFKWGADLTVSGHYHGGVIRFTRHQGAVSPQFEIFPSYCCGDFSKGSQRMVVSAGMGEHSIPMRIHNPRVLVEINLIPLEKNRFIQYNRESKA